MSKKTRKKRKPPIKVSLPKKKVEPTKKEPKAIVFEEGFEVSKEVMETPRMQEMVATGEVELIKEEDPKKLPTLIQTQIEAILLEAPTLPWEIDKGYIDIDFRKGYVALLRSLVKLYGLPYNVNQVGKLTPK